MENPEESVFAEKFVKIIAEKIKETLDLQKEIRELQKQNASLQSQLKDARNLIEQYRNYSHKSYQNDYDYVPYYEDDGHGRE